MKWTIRNKLLAGFGVNILLLIVMLFIQWIIASRAIENAQEVENLEVPGLEISYEMQVNVFKVQDVFTDALATYSINNLSEAEKYKESVYQQIEELIRLHPDDKEKTEEFKNAFTIFYESGLEMIKSANESGWDRTVINNKMDSFDKKAEIAKEETNHLVEEFKDETNSSVEAVVTNNTTSRTMLLIVVLLIIVVSVMVALFMSNRMGKTINDLLELARAVSDGDLSHSDVMVNTKDEMRDLAKALNRMKRNLYELVSTIKNNMEAVSSAATQISSSSEELASGAEEQSSQAAEVASSVEEMTATIVESSENANAAADGARKASTVAEEGRQVVDETIQGMNGIAVSVKSSAEVVSELGRRSTEIGEIIGVINDIADQTNLLALNAAIEAARAGEQGRGFAVVADEVRKLAERTTKATAEIADMIKAIQEDTGKAVESINEGTEQVASGQELASKADEALKKIVEESNQTLAMIEQIATATAQQSTAAEEISHNIEGISTVTRQSAVGAQEMAKAAEDLNKQTEELAEMIARFKL